jgi:hypothetical protein
VAEIDDLSTPKGLIALYHEMDRALVQSSTTTAAGAADAVTRLATAEVPGAEFASISQGRDGRFRTLASTGDVASTGDQIQYDLGSGPCVDAILQDTVFRTGDLAGDTRWPEFSARASAESGAVSMLSLRLFMENDDRISGLNLYSTHPYAFDDDSQTIATVLATHSALALIAAGARERAAHLEKALLSNRRIGMAMGVLMASHKLTQDDAFILLRMASQNTNRKLTDIADEVITTGILEVPHPRSATPQRRPDRDQPSKP